jgi:hypothetical protein
MQLLKHVEIAGKKGASTKQRADCGTATGSCRKLKQATQFSLCNTNLVSSSLRARPSFLASINRIAPCFLLLAIDLRKVSIHDAYD